MSNVTSPPAKTLGAAIEGLAQMSVPEAMAAVGNYMMVQKTGELDVWIKTLQGNVTNMRLVNDLLAEFTEVQKELRNQNSMDMTKMKAVNDLLDFSTDFYSNSNKRGFDMKHEIVRSFG
jgi:hypothetical protein